MTTALLRICEALHEVEGAAIDFVHSFLVKPLKAFSMFPNPVLYRLFLSVDIRADAMLLSCGPPAVVLASIGPVVNPVALLLITGVLTVISNTISIDVNSVALHFVVGPTSVVLAAVRP